MLRGELGWVENDVALSGIELAVGLECELRIPKYCPGLQRQLPQLEHPFARPSRFVRANDGGMRRNQSSDTRPAQSAKKVAARGMELIKWIVHSTSSTLQPCLLKIISALCPES